MAKWNVEMTAKLTPVWLDIVVEADDEESARTRAKEQAAQLASGCWEVGDATVEDIQAESASEIQ